MEILMQLMVYIGPAAIVFCVLKALRSTRIVKKDKPIPTHLIGMANSVGDMTGTERKWNLKK